MQNGEENKYLGKEKISKLLLKFSIPCILALLITSLYNIVDQIFIGHGTAEGLGAVGNAATSIVFPITLVAVALSGMFSIVIISIFFQAVGEPLKATIVSLSRDIILFVPLVIILSQVMNNIDGVLWAAPTTDVVGIVVAVSLAISYFRHLGRDAKATSAAATIRDTRPGIIITIARQHGSQGKKNW